MLDDKGIERLKKMYKKKWDKKTINSHTKIPVILRNNKGKQN